MKPISKLINESKQIIAEDHGFTNWDHLVDYLCHSNEQTLLKIYIDEFAITYADAKIYEDLELPSLTYHSCEHCGCHCECSDKPCSCCPQKEQLIQKEVQDGCAHNVYRDGKCFVCGQYKPGMEQYEG